MKEGRKDDDVSAIPAKYSKGIKNVEEGEETLMFLSTPFLIHDSFSSASFAAVLKRNLV